MLFRGEKRDEAKYETKRKETGCVCHRVLYSNETTRAFLVFSVTTHEVIHGTNGREDANKTREANGMTYFKRENETKKKNSWCYLREE